jgi:hypothetical protein
MLVSGPRAVIPDIDSGGSACARLAIKLHASAAIFDVVFKWPPSDPCN